MLQRTLVRTALLAAAAALVACPAQLPVPTPDGGAVSGPAPGAALASTPGAAAGAALDGRRATLLFTADLWGYLAPCGCSENMRGGIDRAAAYVAAARAGGPTLLVDAGDALFDKTAYGADEEVQARRKAQAVAEALAAMGVAARGSFERDRTLPDAAAALAPGLTLTSPRVLAVGPLKVGLVSADLLAAPAEAAATLASGAKLLRAQGAELVVALVHGKRPEVIKLASRLGPAGITFVVGSHVESEAEGELARAAPGEVPAFFSQGRGQSLLRVDVVLRDGGAAPVWAGSEEAREKELSGLELRMASYLEKVAHPEELNGGNVEPYRLKVVELTERRRLLTEAGVTPPATGSYLAYRFVPMTEDRPSDPAVQELVKRYDADVAAQNLRWAQEHGKDCPPPGPEQRAYVGDASCVGCHEQAQAFSETKKHEHAYRTLEDGGKQYDLSCVGCHVTGWQEPGGVCRVDKVEGRKNVTCESCHGPGSLHLTDQGPGTIALKVSEATCKSCHTPEHSSAFDYALYLSRVVGPGHGGKAAK